jgi:radical SAM protein with 4Fe4S-binding SPASM domain
MDLGTFLFYLVVDNTPLLVRCKPVGHSTENHAFGNGRLVLWDQDVFGLCHVCHSQLERLQVCENCKVVYYCSRKCQKEDWDQEHSEICSNLAFYLPADLQLSIQHDIENGLLNQQNDQIP